MMASLSQGSRNEAPPFGSADECAGIGCRAAWQWRSQLVWYWLILTQFYMKLLDLGSVSRKGEWRREDHSNGRSTEVSHRIHQHYSSVTLDTGWNKDVRWNLKEGKKLIHMPDQAGLNLFRATYMQSNLDWILVQWWFHSCLSSLIHARKALPSLPI